MGILDKAERELDLYVKAGNELHPAVYRYLMKALEAFIQSGTLSGNAAEYVLGLFDHLATYPDHKLELEIKYVQNRTDIIESYLDVMVLLDTDQLTGDQKREVIRLLCRLGRHQNLTPLTGADDEWDDVSKISGYPLWQNKRDSRVFKESGDRFYFVGARSFEDKDGFYFQNGNSIGYFGGFPFIVPPTQYFRYGEHREW